MSPRRFACTVALALIEYPARICDAIAARLDGQFWPSVAAPLICIADCIERCRERLERASQGGPT